MIQFKRPVSSPLATSGCQRKKYVFLEQVVSQCWLCDGWMGEICCKEVAVPKNSLVSAWSLQITSVAHWLDGGCQLVCKHWPTTHLVVMKCENVQCKPKWRTFAFKVKVALHCCNQHMSKGTTFTLQGKVLCFKFVSFILQFHYSSASVFRNSVSDIQNMGSCVKGAATKETAGQFNIFSFFAASYTLELPAASSNH